MDKARVYVDLNELVEENIVLLSKDDWKTDTNGNQVRLEEGMPISLYSDSAENIFLLAEGTVIKYDLQDFGAWKHVKWCCRFEINGELSKSCYKEMSGKLKIGIMLEAGYIPTKYISRGPHSFEMLGRNKSALHNSPLRCEFTRLPARRALARSCSRAI